MRDRVFLTAAELKTFSPVMGQIPPLARVAAMTEADSQVTSIEQSWKADTKLKHFTYRMVVIIVTVYTVDSRMFGYFKSILSKISNMHFKYVGYI